MTDLASIHTPVLLDECVRLITDGRQAPLIVDCTLGLAGHASAFLQADPQARLIGIDRDQEALTLATERMRDLGLSDRFTPVHAAFDSFSQVLDEQGIKTVDAVFMDLGLSSLQIDENDRGFSYSHDAPLDMRMDPGQSLTARDAGRTWPGSSANTGRSVSPAPSPPAWSRPGKRGRPRAARGNWWP